MPLDKIIKKNLTYASLNTSITEVAQAMRDDDVGAVLVVSEGIPRGIITDRDIVLRCVCEELNLSKLTAEKVMTKGVETVTANQGIYDVAQRMKEAQVRRVAVVDEAGNAIGLLSFDDIFELLSEELSCLRQAVQPIQPKIFNQAA